MTKIIFITLFLTVNLIASSVKITIEGQQANYRAVSLEIAGELNRGDLIYIPALNATIVHDGRRHYELSNYDDYGRVFCRNGKERKVIIWDCLFHLDEWPEDEKKEYREYTISYELSECHLKFARENLLAPVKDRPFLGGKTYFSFKSVSFEEFLKEDLSSLRSLKCNDMEYFPSLLFTKVPIETVFFDLRMDILPENYSKSTFMPSSIQYLSVSATYRSAKALKSLTNLKFLQVVNDSADSKYRRSDLKSFEFIFANKNLRYLYLQRIPLKNTRVFFLTKLRFLNLVDIREALNLYNLSNMEELEELNVLGCIVDQLNSVAKYNHLRKVSFLGTVISRHSLKRFKRSNSHIVFNQSATKILTEALKNVDRFEFHLERERTIPVKPSENYKQKIAQLNADYEKSKDPDERKEILSAVYLISSQLVTNAKTVRESRQLFQVKGASVQDFINKLKVRVVNSSDIYCGIDDDYCLLCYHGENVILKLGISAGGYVKWYNSGWGLSDFARLSDSSFNMLIKRLLDTNNADEVKVMQESR